jgi:hypothetical protein
MRALSRAANSPGYPLTSGTAELRDAIVSYLTRRWGAADLDPEATLPVIGTKELVAWLPTLLGLGRDDLVVYPTMAYPTYLVGAKIAGCRAVACDDLDQLGNARPALIWINSPSNPTGQIIDPQALKDRVSWAASMAHWLPPTSVTGNSVGTLSQSRCCIRRSTKDATTACLPCIPSPSARTLPATGPDSWRVIDMSWPTCC